jgi:transposase InsO family protein
MRRLASKHWKTRLSGVTEVFNSDQGCQFTSEGFIDVLKDHDIQISMDGKGRWIDNVFLERLWRSLKYEEVYLKAYDTVAQARQGIGEWTGFYNQHRRHASLGRMTPDQIYYDLPSGLPIAALIRLRDFTNKCDLTVSGMGSTSIACMIFAQ